MREASVYNPVRWVKRKYTALLVINASRAELRHLGGDKPGEEASELVALAARVLGNPREARMLVKVGVEYGVFNIPEEDAGRLAGQGFVVRPADGGYAVFVDSAEFSIVNGRPALLLERSGPKAVVSDGEDVAASWWARLSKAYVVTNKVFPSDFAAVLDYRRYSTAESDMLFHTICGSMSARDFKEASEAVKRLLVWRGRIVTELSTRTENSRETRILMKPDKHHLLIEVLLGRPRKTFRVQEEGLDYLTTLP